MDSPTSNIWVNLSLFSTLLILVALVYVRHQYDYWKRRNIPYLKPKFPLGNNTTIFPKGISIGKVSVNFYDQFKPMRCKVGGVFLGLDPRLVVMDPDYIRTILTTDFQYFVDRGIYSCENDPITVNIFAQTGVDWTNARRKFTTMFTAAKIKMILQILLNCSQEMISSLEKNAGSGNSDVDILETLGCFTTDVIGNVIFGIECNSFKQPDAEFRKFGRQLFDEFTLKDKINLFLTIYFPKWARKLGVSNIQPEVSRFFMKTVKETVRYRETNNVSRPDFLQLLIEMKNSNLKLSMDEIVGQVFLFFSAGFETSSTTMTLGLFELGQNQEVQDRVREEIVEVLNKHNNEITYDAIMEMKFLDQIFDETLRKWPPVATITRVCTKEYKIPDSDLVIEKGTGILIPVLSLHLDPDYFPDPMKWDPDRFDDSVKQRSLLLPFGDGPRNCLGLRLGKIQVKVGLISILRKYRVFLSPNTPKNLDLDPDTFVLHTKQRVYIRIENL